MPDQISWVAIAYFTFITLASLINWAAAWQGRMLLYYISKPLVIIFLIGLFLWQTPLTALQLPFLLGLIFSLIGDVFLIPRSTRWFIAGMGAFSIAQLCYIFGFNLSRPSPAVIILALFALLAGFFILYLAIDHFAETSDVKRSLLPFFKGYSTLVLAMMISALISIARPGWSDSAAVMAGTGGILFFVSDAMIGMDKLNRRLPKYKFWIIFSYHLAQFMIVAAVLQLSHL